MPGYLFALLVFSADPVEFPKVLDDRLQIQLIAAEPEVVTPTGIAVDERGRVLVIESHTHFRPENYQGPPADRILLLEDFEPASGKARKISVFFEGTKHTMSLAAYHDGSIYVATRMEIFRLRDKDGDGKADERTPICHLETPGNYPHNGLSGLAFDFAGNLYFGFGENLGADYKLIGSDERKLEGGGEGGNIYCCDAEGKNLRRLATGFWNPFGLGFDAFGRLFAVDNDPDSRPPCRLLHIVEGGDYGFRFRNGRKGVHPFTAWNGELPGTLPMVSGTGEAPCAVLAYESDNLPEDYRGDLLVTSWGDHRLERYRLKPRGASFSAEMTPVLLGTQNFRPVGLALAPDGSLFMSDWVDKSYPIHGKGRVWRLSAKNPPQPNRPVDPIAALSSPHGPWREAAARTLLREAAMQTVKESKSERTRSLAARAALAANKQWMAMVDKMPAENREGGRQFLKTAECLVEAIARFRPEDIERATAFGEQMAQYLAGDESVAPGQLIEEFMSLKLPDYFLPGQPAELRFASVQLFGFGGADAMIADWQNDPFVHSALAFKRASQLKRARGDELLNDVPPQLPSILKLPPPQTRLASLREELQPPADKSPLPARVLTIALKQADNLSLRPLAADLLRSGDEVQRLVGVMWVGESRLVERRPQLEAVLKQAANNRQLFECTLAALALLDGWKPSDPKKEPAGEDYVWRLLNDTSSSVEIRRFALRVMRPDHPQLTVEFLTKLLVDADQTIRLEAIRTIRQRPDTERWTQLREVAANERSAAQERCEAILGLSPGNHADRTLLFQLAHAGNGEVSDEALRALRGFDLSEEEKDQLTQLAAKLAGPHKELAERALLRNPPNDLPKHEDLPAWLARAEGDGNPQAGERIFYHLRVGGCFRCHEFEGRGFVVGPDLSTIGRSLPRERLVQSIVDPSREIAPQFTAYTILRQSGELLTGIHIGDEVDGRMRFADQNGRAFYIHPNDIDRRIVSKQSIMPEGLADNLTPQELRDVVAFLLRK